ncbi:MAG: NAD(P)-dependent oxidoreductase [Hyphomicrobiaceae bacterium]
MSMTVGFIGLGVMGRPMCHHLATKRGDAGISRVIAWDRDPGAVARLAHDGVEAAASLSQLATAADVVHLCLPGGAELEHLCFDGNRNGVPPLRDAGLRAGTIVLDHGTSPVPLTRRLETAFADSGVRFCDAPITRTRAAAEAGTLVVLFGGPADVLDRVRPLLGCFAEVIEPCGPVGSGQIVKQMNNMVLIQTVAALAEALATARAAGLEDGVLARAMEAGSADSFALRNHGRKALWPGEFPLKAFSARYALKDLTYAVELAESLGLDLRQARGAQRLLEAAIASGDGDRYFPVLLRQIDER